MANILIQVQNLCKTYENEGVKTPAVCGVNFNVQKGEFVSIMGPSGSGKSTLMQLLGFLDRPTDGQYFFDGRDTTTFNDDELAYLRNKEIGFVFQTFNLLPRTSVYENVELPLLYDADAKGDNREKVTRALKSVAIDHREKYLSNQLSGGERQRVAFARALVNEPSIVFADEPTGNLDSVSGNQIMMILQKLNNEGTTIILVTHETFTALHGKRMIMMKDGHIISDEPIKERHIAHDGMFLK